MGCSGSTCCKDEKDYSIVGVEKDKSRKHASNFNGPVNERSCTDIFCCILFIIFIILFSAISIWAFKHGNVNRLANPTDSEGKVCGVDYPDRPYLFFFDLTKCLSSIKKFAFMCPTKQVCVTRCPKNHWLYKSNQEELGNMVCLDGKTGLDFPGKTVDELVKKDICAPYVLPSKGLFKRCIPKQIVDLISKNNTDYTNFDEVFDENGNKVAKDKVEKGSKFVMRLVSFLETVTSDIRDNKWAILGALIAAVVVSLLYIIVMRFTATIVVWFTLVIFFLLFLAGTIFSFYKFVILRNTSEANEVLTLSLNVTKYFKMAKTWLALGIIGSIALVIISIVLIFLRKHIKLAIGVIEETSKGLAHMMTIIFWPIFPFILTVLISAYCITVFATLNSVVDPQSAILNDTSLNKSSSLDCSKYNATSKMHDLCVFVGYGSKKYIIYLQVFSLFMMYWLINFVKALDEMTLSGAYAYYYFSSNNRQKLFPTLPLLTSLKNALFYHLGTLAFGSLLISILQMIRTFLEFLEHKLKTTENAVAKFFLKCLKCCFWCLEKFLRFLNRNAYIMTAIYGQNFCTAAANAFGLILRNCVRVFVLDKVADFVLFIGKLIIVSICIGIYMAINKGNVQLPDNLLSLAVVVVGSFLIATLFFSVFVMGIDTIFLCLLEDLERNDGSAEKPYWMSKGLLQAVNKHNKGEDAKIEK